MFLEVPIISIGTDTADGHASDQPYGAAQKSSSRTPVLVAGLLMVCTMGLIAWIGVIHSPNLDEVGHLPAGCLCVEFGNFELYEVNPPLVKSMAAIPVVLSRPEYDWSSLVIEPGVRKEWTVGRKFIHANGPRAFWFYTLARWALLPLWLLAAVVIFLWARELGGGWSGVAAVSCWCICPDVLGWSATICPDSGAAATGILALWMFRKWLLSGTWEWAAAAGLSLGLALLTKTTWLILIPLLPLMALLPSPAKGIRKFRQVLLAGAIALYVLNTGYGFSRTGTKLGDFKFFSEALAGRTTDGSLRQKSKEHAGNRFRGTVVEHIPVPLPASLIEGIDLQKYDFEEGKWSYLRGEHRMGGWWYWYLYAFAVKTPLGLLAVLPLAAFASVRSLRRRIRTPGNQPAAYSLACELLILLLPAAVVLLLVSSQTGFSRYLRYLLPCYPALFIFLGLAVSDRFIPQKGLRATAWCLIALAGLSSLSVYPHSESFFNVAAGGPANAPKHLLDASVDWGEEILLLAEWQSEHPDAEPFFLSLHSLFDPRDAGLKYEHPPYAPQAENDREWVTTSSVGPTAGWYAISVHQLYGRHGEFSYLHDFKPVETIGHSIHIFHLSEEEAAQWNTEHAPAPDS